MRKLVKILNRGDEWTIIDNLVYGRIRTEDKRWREEHGTMIKERFDELRTENNRLKEILWQNKGGIG